MGVIGVLVLSLIHKGFLAEARDDSAVSRKGAGTDWKTITTDNFTIYYAPEFADDAQKANTYLDSTIESLRKEFSGYEPEKILKKIDCDVYLYPEPNEIASDGRSVCITRGIDGGRRQAELHFLTPGAIVQIQRTQWGAQERGPLFLPVHRA